MRSHMGHCRLWCVLCQGHECMITMSLRLRYWIDPAARISQMRFLLSIAAIAHLLFVSQFSDAYAADPYDGEWTGSARGSSDGPCKLADVTLTVHGKVVT